MRQGAALLKARMGHRLRPAGRTPRRDNGRAALPGQADAVELRIIDLAQEAFEAIGALPATATNVTPLIAGGATAVDTGFIAIDLAIHALVPAVARLFEIVGWEDFALLCDAEVADAVQGTAADLAAAAFSDTGEDRVLRQVAELIRTARFSLYQPTPSTD